MSEIKLDFDKPEKPNFQKIWAVLGICGIIIDAIRVSKSKHGGTHVLIKTKPVLRDWEILTLQAIMGSDWKRETFNYIRVKAITENPRGWEREYWERNWNVLFEGNDGAGRDSISRQRRKNRS